MPTYGYRCEQCSAEFDVWQKMSDEPGAACPACGGAGRRLFYPAGIVFKGSGFYKTDSRSSSTSSPTVPPGSDGAAPVGPTGPVGDSPTTAPTTGAEPTGSTPAPPAPSHGRGKEASGSPPATSAPTQ